MKNLLLSIIIGFIIVTWIISLIILIPTKRSIKSSKQIIEYNLEKEQQYKILIFQNSLFFNSSLLIDSMYLPLIFKKNDFQYCIIYRYDLSMCNDCIFSDLELLKNILPKIGVDRICILPSCDNSRESKIELENELKRFNYSIVQRDKIQLPMLENEYRRFFAVIDNSGKIVSLFLPTNTLPSLTFDYLNSFCKKWFK